ncbi:MAG: hypothetical protein DRR08_08830 [Candidatus Parabeggiatoa sp. nov. 2]|nr:MAG: hypothetical protein B6247_05425 [Beggiatoa sp. 4572_84]RKZ61403.1 MAG: hypothetical protein DRR08_08830 [Gammaproteobacteria bacterium]
MVKKNFRRHLNLILFLFRYDYFFNINNQLKNSVFVNNSQFTIHNSQFTISGKSFAERNFCLKHNFHQPRLIPGNAPEKPQRSDINIARGTAPSFGARINIARGNAPGFGAKINIARGNAPGTLVLQDKISVPQNSLTRKGIE